VESRPLPRSDHIFRSEDSNEEAIAACCRCVYDDEHWRVRSMCNISLRGGDNYACSPNARNFPDSRVHPDRRGHLSHKCIYECN
jgi:hypothetical protein